MLINILQQLLPRKKVDWIQTRIYFGRQDPDPDPDPDPDGQK